MAEDDEHLIRFAVQPVPGLALTLQSPSPSSDVARSDLVEYTLTGPPEALSTLRTAAGVGPEDRLPPILRTGHLSPIHPITLTEGDLAASSVAQKIKVPEGAKSFAFSYPFDIDATWFARITGLLSAGSGVDYIQPEWLNFLLVGGYCYFGEDGGLLGGELVLDPNLEEEALLSASLTLLLDARGEMRLLHKPGGAPLPDGALETCLAAARTRVGALVALIGSNGE